MDVTDGGNRLKCWGRAPLGAAYTFSEPVENVMYVGQGKIRPAIPGENVTPIPGSTAERQPRSQTQTMPGPHRPHLKKPFVKNPPPKEPAQEPVEPAQEEKPQSPFTPNPATFAVPPGYVDSEDIMPRPRQQQEPIKEELLQPAVFHRPSARDAYQNRPPQQQPQPQNDNTRSPKRGKRMRPGRTKAD